MLVRFIYMLSIPLPVKHQKYVVMCENIDENSLTLQQNSLKYAVRS